MARKNPGTPPAVEKRSYKQMGLINEKRTYKLITPLFGGGAEAWRADSQDDPQSADEVTVVRGTEVRGVLRFWWRATRGGKFGGNWRRMKECEDKIWGKAADKKGGASKVIVEIVPVNKGEDKPPFYVVPKPQGGFTVRRNTSVAPPYAAFPLQPQGTLNEKSKCGVVRENVSFKLEITYPDIYSKDIQAALWAWETFGGVGARTRRGFGALRCTHVNKDKNAAPQAASLKQDIRQKLEEFEVHGVWPDSVPHLAVTMKLCPVSRGAKWKPHHAWSYLITKLSEFRQDRHEGRTIRNRRTGKETTLPGRSKWAEPDAIRRLFLGPYAHDPVNPSNSFARSQFGLPIVFKFKSADVGRGDPPRTTLQGADYERMASRLILRPIVCAGDIAVGLAAVLEGPIEPDGGLILKGVPEVPSTTPGAPPIISKDPPVRGDVTGTDLNPPGIEPLDGGSDVLQAFLNTLKPLK